MQIKSSASPDDHNQSSMISLKIEHFQSKTKQLQSTDVIKGEIHNKLETTNTKNAPIKIEIQKKDKEKQPQQLQPTSTTVSVNNFKLQTPGKNDINV